jgi:hypothetical protein
MGEAAKGFDPLKLVRDARDAALDASAKLVLRLTGSQEYQRVQSFVVKPTLLVVAVFRKASEGAMSELLAQLNMPSREEVLSLSQRLTHIEMTLDDVGAAVDQLRRAVAARPQRAIARAGDSGAQPDARTLSAKEA